MLSVQNLSLNIWLVRRYLRYQCVCIDSDHCREKELVYIPAGKYRVEVEGTDGCVSFAEAEVKALRSSGTRTNIRDKNKPTTLVIEQAINNAGLKANVDKIESSGKNGARVILNEVSFNQMLVWLNTLAKHNGIHVTSANIERTSATGKTNARLTFERS